MSDKLFTTNDSKMGSAISAVIRIRNHTTSDITSVFVYDMDNFDFGNSRPDKVFNGSSIPANGCIERTIDFSTISSYCPFTTRLMFRNGREHVFRMNYKCVFDGNETNLRHLTKTYKLQLKRTGPRVLEIVIEYTEEQIENQKAEKLILQGCKLMDLGRCNEASVKFVEAARSASEKETITELKKHIQKLRNIQEIVEVNDQAKSLNSEGLQCLQSMKFQEALSKFEEALRFAKSADTVTLIEDNLKIARDAKLNQDAKKLNQHGLLLRKSDQNESAVLKFDEALRIATDPNIITSIKRNKSETLNNQARETLRKAWDLEMSSSDEAIHYFSKAKFLFQQADSVKPSPEHQHYVVLIDCKIEGGKYFSAALQSENEGSRLVEESPKLARSKFQEAWKSYKEAQKKFQDGLLNKGDANFQRSLELANEALKGIEELLGL